jgi:hypothetical protein
MVARVGEAVRPKLGIDVGDLWSSSGEDEGTKGGISLRRSSWGSRLGSEKRVAAW